MNFLPWDWVNPVKWLEYVRGGRREDREDRAETRETTRFQEERRQIAVDRQRALRDNLRERVSNETDANEKAKLEIQLRAADQTLTSLLKDLALDDPRVRYYFTEAMRELVPREVRPTLPLPEEARATAVLVAEAAEAAGASPTTADDYFLRGNAHYLAAQYDQALADYNRSLELRPDDPATVNNRGNALSRLGRHEEALAGYNRSLELRPDDAVTLSNRGNALADLGRYEEALVDHNRSLALRPDDPDTLNNRGNALAGLARHQEALSDYNRSLALRPDNPDTLANRGAALDDLGRQDEALADYDRTLELRPDHSRTYYNRACLFSLQGKVSEAIGDLARAIKSDPKYGEKARTDRDFDGIRSDPRFRAFVEGDEPLAEGTASP